MLRYHDEEWGVPLHDDTKLFELLTLEGAQAGLSWETILRRRDGHRAAFAAFDRKRVAAFTDEDVARLLTDAGIIRNRAKILATIGNARALEAIVAEFGSLDAYVWRFVEGRTQLNRFAILADLPPQTPASTAMSKDLRKRGVSFVGPTICYAFMQSAGLVNDHVVGCFRYAQLATTT